MHACFGYFLAHLLRRKSKMNTNNNGIEKGRVWMGLLGRQTADSVLACVHFPICLACCPQGTVRGVEQPGPYVLLHISNSLTQRGQALPRKKNPIRAGKNRQLRDKYMRICVNVFVCEPVCVCVCLCIK